MAVALATLPVKRRLAGDGDGFLTSAGAAGELTDFAAPLVGFFAAALPRAALVAVLAATLLLLLAAGAAFFDTVFGGGVFLLATFAGSAFLGATAFLATGACLGKTFFAATFFAAGLLAGAAFFTTAAFLAAGLATALAFVVLALGLAAAFFATAGLADFTGWADFAGDLLTFFTAVPFADAVFDTAVLRLFALVEAFSLCAFSAPELRVVFAISLHRGWPWRPGVISQVSFTSKSGSGILANTTSPTPFWQRDYSDTIDTVVDPFVQALDQSLAWPPLPLLPELFGVCTDRRHTLWSVAWWLAGRLAHFAMPAALWRRRRSGARTLSLPPLPSPRRILRQSLSI